MGTTDKGLAAELFETTIKFRVNNVSALKTKFNGPRVSVSGKTFTPMLQVCENKEGRYSTLGFFLNCDWHDDFELQERSCKVKIEYSLHALDGKSKNLVKKASCTFIPKLAEKGFSQFIPWFQLIQPAWMANDSISLEIKVEVEKFTLEEKTTKVSPAQLEKENVQVATTEFEKKNVQMAPTELVKSSVLVQTGDTETQDFDKEHFSIKKVDTVLLGPVTTEKEFDRKYVSETSDTENKVRFPSAKTDDLNSDANCVLGFIGSGTFGFPSNQNPGITTPNPVNKEWHKSISSELKDHFVEKIAQAFFSSEDKRAMSYRQMNTIDAFAKLLEGKLYDLASSREEYFHSQGANLKFPADLSPTSSEYTKQKSHNPRVISNCVPITGVNSLQVNTNNGVTIKSKQVATPNQQSSIASTQEECVGV